MPDAPGLERDLRAFLRDELGVDEADLDRDAELFSTGLIDSADLVRLATFVERALGVRVPDGDVDTDHFDSIARIVAYAERRLAEGAGGEAR